MSEQDGNQGAIANTPRPQPECVSARLRLRPFQLTDAPDVQAICSNRTIAEMTRTIPHPYPPGAAREWIESLEQKWAEGASVTFAIERRERPGVVGAIGLMIDPSNEHAELGYWIAPACWGQGIATEAARETIAFGFQELGLHRIFAHHMTHNPASGRVLAKAGMVREGLLRHHVKKWGVFRDIIVYGVISGEWRLSSTDDERSRFLGFSPKTG